MINNYYPLYLYTIGFLFLLLFVFHLSLCPPTFVIIRGARAHTIDAPREQSYTVSGERTHFCARTQIDTHTAEVTLISEKLSKAKTKKKTENGCLMMSLAKWWDRFAVSFIKKLPTVCFLFMFFFFSFVYQFVLCKLFLYFAAAAGYERD